MTITPLSTGAKILLLMLLLAIGTLLWWLSSDSVRPFIQGSNNAVFLQPEIIRTQLKHILQQQPKAAKGQVTLVHFWNPDCLCNSLSQTHFDDLLAEYDSAALRVLVLAPSTISAEQEAAFTRLNAQRMRLIKSALPFPASPALALFDDKHNIGYYGPYGFGAQCIPAGESFFSALVKLYQVEATALYMNVIGEGCYCNWPIEYQAHSH